MKVLILALDEQFCDALVAQFSLRERPFDIVGLDWLAAATDKALVIPREIGLVVNALSLECLQQSADERFIDDLSLLAQACDKAGLPLIHLSNSQVFDGFDEGDHREEDDVVPASRIGALLSRMEELLRGSCQRHIIIRTGELFSSQGNNVLTLLLKKFEQGEKLTLSSQGHSCPLHSRDLARVISAIIDQLSCGCESWGTYHYSSSDPVSSYHFAETVLAVASQYIDANQDDFILQPLENEDIDWSRPLLNCEKILNTFGIKQLPWRVSVVPAVKMVYQPNNAAS